MAHDVGRWKLGTELVAHEVHGGSHMGKETAIALAEVVYWFAGLGASNTIFRALAIARKEPFAFAALLG